MRGWTAWICLALIFATLAMPWIARLCGEDEAYARQLRQESREKHLARGSDAFIGEWKVKMSPEPGAGGKAFADTLIFTRGGKFESVTLRKEGFEPTDYQADTRGITTNTFTAESASEKQGKIKWTGVVSSGAIRGEMLWTRADGEERHFSYDGEKK